MTDAVLASEAGVVPRVLVGMDLGSLPELQRAGRSLTALSELYESVKDGLGLPRTPPPPVLRSYDGVEHAKAQTALLLKRRSHLHVERISVASPLEVVLTVLTDKSAPIAYAVAAFYLVERSVRLLMDWQRHRADLDRATAVDAISQEILDAIVEQRAAVAKARIDVGLPSDEEHIAAKLKTPLMQLARAGKVIKVERG
jgi:hypothetical protein